MLTSHLDGPTRMLLFLPTRQGPKPWQSCRRVLRRQRKRRRRGPNTHEPQGMD